MRVLVLFLTFAVFSCLLQAQKPPAKRPAARPKGPLPAEQQRQTTEAEDRAAIEQLHQDDIAGSLAFDVDKLTGTWDDEIVSMPPNSKPIVGKAANHEFLESQRKAMTNVEILAYEETWDEVRVMGDYAYEYGSIHSRIRQATAKDETPLDYSVMRVLKKQPRGAWKIYRTIWNDRKAASEEKPAAK